MSTNKPKWYGSSDTPLALAGIALVVIILIVVFIPETQSVGFSWHTEGKTTIYFIIGFFLLLLFIVWYSRRSAAKKEEANKPVTATIELDGRQIHSFVKDADIKNEDRV